MAGKAKTEVDGTIRGRRIKVDSDWFTVTLIVLGLVCLLGSIWGHLVRFAHGDFSAHTANWVRTQALFGWYVAFIAVNIAIKADVRVVRFAFAFLSGALVADLGCDLLFNAAPNGYLALAVSVAYLVSFLLFAVWGIQWLRAKVKLV